MATLYELKQDYQKLLEMMYDDESGSDAIKDTLELLDFEIEEKAENYAKIIKQIEGDVETISLEIDRLTGKRNRMTTKIKALQNNLFEAMVLTGKRKFKTPLFSFTIVKNGGLAPLKIDGDVPEEYKTTPEPVPNLKAIRELLGKSEVPWAHLEERGERLNIR